MWTICQTTLIHQPFEHYEHVAIDQLAATCSCFNFCQIAIAKLAVTSSPADPTAKAVTVRSRSRLYASARISVAKAGALPFVEQLPVGATG